jgi:hypothetical protein
MRFSYKLTVILAAIIASLVILTACEPAPTTTQEKQEQAQQESLDNTMRDEPPYVMQHSPGRHTANAWAKAWDDPNKPAYIYIFDSVGHKIMYFVIEGPPVSYCASTVSPQQLVRSDGGDYTAETPMPAPAQDGMYYVNANCAQMYGIDYTTKKIVEWTGGGSFNYIVTEDPLQDPEFQDFPQGGATSIKDMENE